MRGLLSFLNLEESSAFHVFLDCEPKVLTLNTPKSRPFHTAPCCLYRYMGGLQGKGRGEKAFGLS